MSTISQIVDRAQLIAMSAEGLSSPKYDNDWIAELLYPSVMKKVIIDAGNDPYKSKDVRITQNISVTSGVGTLPTNVALECIETANVLATGAATWAISAVTPASLTVAGSGYVPADGDYIYNGVQSNKPYYNKEGAADDYTTSSIYYDGFQPWTITGLIANDIHWGIASGAFTATAPANAFWTPASGGFAPAPTVTQNDDYSTITVTGHAFTTGEQVTLSTTSALPSPLVINTVYYIIVIDDNTIRLATSYANAIAGTFITIADIGAGTGTITPQTLPPASYVRDYNDYLRPLPDIFSYWTTQGGSFYYKLIIPSTARARAAFTGTIPFNSVVFPIVSSNEVSIVAGTSLASDIVDDIVTALASAIRGEVSLASQIDAT